MAKKSTASSAPVAAEAEDFVPGTAQETASPLEAVSGPSGVNGPDGSLLTGEIVFGDSSVETAASDASGSLATHTPQSESGNVAGTESPVSEIPHTGNDEAFGQVIEPNPEVPASVSGIDARALKHALDMTGCTDIDDLIDAAIAGKDAKAWIAESTSDENIFEGGPAVEPAEMLKLLFGWWQAAARRLSSLSVATNGEVVPGEQRRFITSGRVRQNNILKDIGSVIDLNEIEHALLFTSGAVDMPWNKGFAI